MRVTRTPRAHPAVVGRGVCAGGDRREAIAGARMLEAGGNAVDAAVAAAFVGFVVEQVDCGVGGFAHVSVCHRGELLSFDGYVRAPAAARPDMFAPPVAPASYYGHPIGDAQRHGGRAVAVPGAVAGLCEAHERCGRLPLSTVLAPAIAHAEDGVAFGHRDVLAIAAHLPTIRALPETAGLLLPGGEPPRLSVQQPGGDRLETRALAETLKHIADRGADGFYRGEVARRIAERVEALGGILSVDDLAAYRPRVVRERPGRYRGLDHISCLDHVAYEALNILAGFDLGALGADSVAYRHLVAEALAVAFTDSLTHYGDPEHVASPVRGLASEAYAATRRAQIRLESALPRPVEAGDPWPFERAPAPADGSPGPAPVERSGTSQMVAADDQGNLCAIITAVGWTYGSLVYVPEVGAFLNNGMSYFDPRPGRPSSIAPGKTPMFGAPALVARRDGRGAFAAAGSGGYRIETAVLHALMNTVDHRMPIDAALAHPRVHCQGGPTFVDDRIEAPTREALASLGHDVVALEEDVHTLGFGRVCAIERHEEGWRASAEPSWASAVATV